jgi:hypothetical protein
MFHRSKNVCSRKKMLAIMAPFHGATLQNVFS